MKNLVIVESPAKAKTIEKILGKDFTVIASYGHFRDLPKGKLGIDIEDNYKPQYVLSRDKQKNITMLKKNIQEAETIWLAPDLDREGEAIAWHLTQLCKRDSSDFKRITFSEITESAIKEAVNNPREINLNLVDSQIARRVIDRLVGFELSPVLWKKVKVGLSAGRVQSVALMVIVDREKERDDFKIEEYYELEFRFENKDSQSFSAKLAQYDNQNIERLDKQKAQEILNDLKDSSYSVKSYKESTKKRSPEAPFTTSSLQQAANSVFGFGAKRTMTIAQKLYEEGKITYMRTDSTNIAEEAMKSLRSNISKNFGDKYLSQSINKYKSKTKNAQEAHEAVRPSDFNLKPGPIVDDQSKLYALIYSRAIASQMTNAIYATQSAEIITEKALLKASGQTLNFDGFMAAGATYIKSGKESSQESAPKLPVLESGESLKLLNLESTQHFTKPPARYNEASLVKKLEELGVGRPSTYANIISTIIDRGYVVSENKQLIPEKIGIAVANFLKLHFNFVTDSNFTAKIEDELDDVANGSEKWQQVVDEVYKPMQKRIEEAINVDRVEIEKEYVDKECPKCGKQLIVRSGRYGKFLGCSGFPDCRHIEALTLDIPCPECGEEKGGKIVEKKSTKGKFKSKFYGCSRYPDCKFISKKLPEKTKDDQ